MSAKGIKTTKNLYDPLECLERILNKSTLSTQRVTHESIIGENSKTTSAFLAFACREIIILLLSAKAHSPLRCPVDLTQRAF